MDGAQESTAEGKLLWLGSIALARDNISDRSKGQGFITLLFQLVRLKTALLSNTVP